MDDRHDPNLLLGYVEDGLTAADRARVEAMLAEDPGLAALVAGMKQDRDTLRRSTAPEPPTDLAEGALAALERQMLFDDDRADFAAPPPPTRRFRLAPLLTYGGIAAVLAITVGVVIQSLRGTSGDGNASSSYAYSDPVVERGLSLAEAPIEAQRKAALGQTAKDELDHLDAETIDPIDAFRNRVDQAVNPKLSAGTAARQPATSPPSVPALSQPIETQDLAVEDAQASDLGGFSADLQAALLPPRLSEKHNEAASISLGVAPASPAPTTRRQRGQNNKPLTPSPLNFFAEFDDRSDHSTAPDSAEVFAQYTLSVLSPSPQRVAQTVDDWAGRNSVRITGASTPSGHQDAETWLRATASIDTLIDKTTPIQQRLILSPVQAVDLVEVLSSNNLATTQLTPLRPWNHWLAPSDRINVQVNITAPPAPGKSPFNPEPLTD